MKNDFDPAISRQAESSKRPGLFAFPVLSLLLAVTWLAVVRTIEPVHLLSAALVGLFVPRVIASFVPGSWMAIGRINWVVALKLTAVVLYDIVKSNLIVARIVLGPMNQAKPAWVPVPLDSDHPMVNALFASIITTTPGTVSCVIDEARREIVVHALDCSDIPAAVADMKARYEAPLLKIFGVEVR